MRPTDWHKRADPAVITRSFWAAIFGLVLEKAAMDEHVEPESALADAYIQIALDHSFDALGV